VANLARLRLTPRQWRVYLAVWLAALAAVAGVLAGVVVPRLLTPAPPAVLGGGVVMGAHEVQAPGFSLRDQNGATVDLAQLRGKVIALTFLDTQCLNLCPLQASMLGRAQAELGRGAPFDIVVVSVRPDGDTPAAITAFAGNHGLAGPYHWLTGPQPALAVVWNHYGVAVQVADGDLAHSSVIYLIDRDGYERVAFADVPETGPFETDVRLLAAT
jgi:protein SCO1/2